MTFHRLSDDQTRLMIQIDWEPSGLVEKAGAAVGVDDHRVKADAKRFKEFIESRGGNETGALARRGGRRRDRRRPRLKRQACPTSTDQHPTIKEKLGIMDRT